MGQFGVYALLSEWKNDSAGSDSIPTLYSTWQSSERYH